MLGTWAAALGLEIRAPGHSILVLAADETDFLDWRTKLFHYARRTLLFGWWPHGRPRH